MSKARRLRGDHHDEPDHGERAFEIVDFTAGDRSSNADQRPENESRIDSSRPLE
jgi:hypothetical protein